MYLGQVGKGVAILLAAMGSYFIVPILGSLVICVFATVDAYQVGATLRAGKPVGKWEFFPGNK